MMFCGYTIPTKAIKAGQDTLDSQERSIAISAVARAIEPLIPDSRTAWKPATKWMAACSAAQQLILNAVREGKITAVSGHVGKSMWRRTK